MHFDILPLKIPFDFSNLLSFVKLQGISEVRKFLIIRITIFGYTCERNDVWWIEKENLSGWAPCNGESNHSRSSVTLLGLPPPIGVRVCIHSHNQKKFTTEAVQQLVDVHQWSWSLVKLQLKFSQKFEAWSLSLTHDLKDLHKNCQLCYMDLSKLLYGFVKNVTSICQSCNRYLSIYVLIIISYQLGLIRRFLRIRRFGQKRRLEHKIFVNLVFVGC